MRWTQDQLNAYEARRTPQQKPSKAVERESELHAQIIEECKRRGWLAFHGSMAHRTFRTPGEPDFVILIDNGKTLLVECKSKGGKPTKEQAANLAWAKKLGHKAIVVWSFNEFLEAL